MSSKNSRPYYGSNNSNNRKSRSNKNYGKNSDYNGNKKGKPQKVNLENTTRIRIDDDRLNDFESLDTSFLEGRLDKKVKKSKKAKEKILLEKKRKTFNFKIIKKIFFLTILLCIIVLGVILFINSVQEKRIEKTEKVEEKLRVDIDDNYLFVGDSYTKALDFEDLDYHYVKVSEDDLKIADVLDDLNKKIYRYNPTIIFLELGTVDLKDGREKEEIVNDLEKIVKKIKKNRPYAKVYVESLYPINKDDEDYDDDLKEEFDNDLIKKINKMILEMTKKQEIKYLDMFSLLEKDGKLNEEYTNNGIELNDKGNEKIFEKIEKVVG